jgi:16S rRNA (cytidine1402-2'-O)-methyltransferase
LPNQDLPTRHLPKGLWPQGLWIVATPIGNLEDFTDRARTALKLADEIVCEDTRRTSQLLNAIGLSGQSKLTRLDAHASQGQLEKVIASLVGGANIALVTDAGTPSVSDPGSALVALAHRHGITVTPIPGASAVPTFLSVTGFSGVAFCFRGFFPRKAGDQAREFELISTSARDDLSGIFIWFESPNRILDTLKSFISPAVAAGSRLCVAKELTKVHEQIWTGSPSEVLEQVRPHLEKEGERGEWVFGIELEIPADSKGKSADSSEWVKALHCLVDAGVSSSEAAKKVSQYFGVAKNEVYEVALQLTGKKSAKKE